MDRAEPPASRPKISLIWAQDEHGLIGAGKGLPWRLPADMQWFRRHTLGKPVLMGRRTFEAIGRPLPQRLNIILSRRESEIKGCRVARSLSDALHIAAGAPELMVIGGAEIYALVLPHAERLYITEIHTVFQGDTFFPAFDRGGWREIFREEHAADAVNPHSLSFVILIRREPVHAPR